ncbi:MAG: hypothetical protein L0Z50_30065 [Verrucomicrobiales bacterium]|nr:hypothetical protein [Verrucomicrobiales bacterium]
MNTQTAGYLVIYGLFLILLGAAGYLTNPEKAATALISGGGFGVLSIVWGALAARGIRWSLPAALVTTALMGLACIWRAGVGWLAVSRAEWEKLFPAIVTSLMLGASVVLLSTLVKAVRSKEQTSSDRNES